MADTDLQDVPRGRVAELLGILRTIGLNDAAEMIVQDIVLRRRDHLVLPSDAPSPNAFKDLAARWSRTDEGYPRRPEVTPLPESDKPLTDDEQRATAIRVLELLVIAPSLLVQAATELASTIPPNANTAEEAEIDAPTFVPAFQLAMDRAPLSWESLDQATVANDLRSRLAQLTSWLEEGAST